MKIKSTLVRSIRRAQKYDLIGKNVAELVDLPQGQPGHPSRAMTEEQASKVLQAASGQPTGYVKVVKVSQGKYAAIHAATEAGELACGTWTRLGAPMTEIGADLATTTCRFCREQLGLDADADTARRLEALFVLSITLGLRPGELRKLSWNHVDVENEVIHVWRSASRTGDVKTPKSKRSLVPPSAPSPRSRPTRSARQPNGSLQAPPGRTTRSSFATETGACHQRRAQLAVEQDDQAGRHRRLARPSATAHRGVDHEQHDVPLQEMQPHRWAQVHPRDRDGLPAP